MNSKKLAILILIILSLLFNIFVFYPGFDKYTVSDDVIAVGYVFHNLKYGLFEEDINQLTYAYAVPYGYLYTIYVLSFFIPFLVLTKILPFVLSIFCVVILYLIGLKLKNSRLGYFLSITFLLYSSTFYFFSGALPRAFQFPFILLFIYLFINRKFIWCFFLTALSLIFYPPLNSIFIGALFFSMFRFSKKKPLFVFNKKFFLNLLLLISISFVLLIPISLNFMGKTTYSFSEAQNMPEFNIGGSRYYFGSTVSDFFSRLSGSYRGETLYSGIFSFETSYSVIFTFILLLSLFIFSIIFYKKAWNLPQILFALFLSSTILFFLSHLVNIIKFVGILAFPLYYTKAIFPIFLVFFFSMNLERLVSRFGKKIHIFLVIILLLFIPFYLIYFEHDFEKCPINLKLKEIKSFGDESLFAGHPLFIRFIPLFNKQEIIFNFHSYHPEMRYYHNTMKEMIFLILFMEMSPPLLEISVICTMLLI